MGKRLTTEEFIEKAKKIHGDKYDYSRVKYKGVRKKVEIICSDHGSFWQRASHHLKGQGCPKCAVENNKLTTEEFIERARKIHGDMYDYSRVEYERSNKKVEMICSDHGSFWQTPNNHLNGQGCPKCISNQKLTTEKFIKKAKAVHGDKYDYSKVKYTNAHTKIKIFCPIHGEFLQRPDHHLNGAGCPKCAGVYEKQYTKNNIPVYDKYEPQLSPYGIDCKRNEEDNNVLEVKCMYCDKWHIPSLTSITSKINAINGKIEGEYNLYCSDNCKKACPTYKKIKYPEGFKISTSREVQPALRKLVLKRDNYTCQKCGETDTELHCHHYEGVKINPIESADMDNCITVCKKCHNEIHTKEKCGMKDYRCKS